MGVVIGDRRGAVAELDAPGRGHGGGGFIAPVRVPMTVLRDPELLAAAGVADDGGRGLEAAEADGEAAEAICSPLLDALEVPEVPVSSPHTSAYVSIRQHTSAYVRIRQHTAA